MSNSSNTTALRLAIALVLLVVGAMAQGYQLELEKKAAADLEAQKVAKVEQERSNAEAIQSQSYDTLGLRFAASDDVLQCKLANTLTFLVPAAWKKDGTGTEDLLEYKANDYTGQFAAGIARDICLFCTSDDDVINEVGEQLDILTIDRSRCESGTVGNARWHRFPVWVDNSSKAGNHPYGLMEVILSGHDVYYLYALCYAREYTSRIHQQMLRILNSVDGTFEEPLLLAEENNQTADEGTMRGFLQELGVFAPYTVRGTGAQTLDLPRGSDLSAMPCQCLLDVSYEGTSAFAVSARSIVDGYEDRPLVETDGPYRGTVTNMYSGDGFLSYRQLAIEATGDWELTISPIANTPHATKGTAYTGDAVVLLDVDSLGSLTFAHSGDGAFSVYAAGMEGSKRLVDTTSDYGGSVEWGDPHTLLVVKSAGEWSIDWK